MTVTEWAEHFVARDWKRIDLMLIASNGPHERWYAVAIDSPRHDMLSAFGSTSDEVMELLLDQLRKKSVKPAGGAFDPA